MVDSGSHLLDTCYYVLYARNKIEKIWSEYCRLTHYYKIKHAKQSIILKGNEMQRCDTMQFMLTFNWSLKSLVHIRQVTFQIYFAYIYYYTITFVNYLFRIWSCFQKKLTIDWNEWLNERLMIFVKTIPFQDVQTNNKTHIFE